MCHRRSLTSVVIGTIFLSLAACGCAADKRGEPAPSPSPAPAPVPSPSRPVSVTGADWVLVRLGNDAAMPAEPKARPWFRLDPTEKRRVTGSTGVNVLGGAYELSGGALKFGRMITTKRAGSPELMRQESAFLKALENTVTADLRDRSLVLRDAGGAVLARFEAMDVAP